jgi:ubiquinone/menaquinone biosynthesis C-methylase UbiE
MVNSYANEVALSEAHVPETRFGKWFLRTHVWTDHVLEVAIKDLTKLLGERDTLFPIVADVGCGFGRSLKKLNERFKPEKLIAIDIDQEMLNYAARESKKQDIAPVEFVRCSNSNILLPDNSVDMLFCHQTFHHLIYQDEAIQEYFRVLKPGGVLLFAESTKRYIHSWIIRLLFRHPMKVQKTAEEYLELIRGAGFQVNEDQISYPFLWWSREDLGIMENWFGVKPPEKREETLINLVAFKPE